MPMKSSMIRVLVADDHPIVRTGVRQIIGMTRDIVVADEANSGHEVLSKLSKNSYDVILLDISMPGQSGLDVLKQIKSLKKKVAVLMLSIYPEEQYAIRVMKEGAAGYMTKESAPGVLVEAVKRVLEGRKYVSASLAERLAREAEMGGDKKDLHERLSNREYEVMRLIASGNKLSDIAEMLCLSPKTIGTYRERILEKMGMHSNSELIQYAIQRKLLD